MYHCPAWRSLGWRLAVHACVPGYDLLQMVIRPNMPNAHATTALFPHPENSTYKGTSWSQFSHISSTGQALCNQDQMCPFSNSLGPAQMCKLYTSATSFKERTRRLGIKQISAIMPPVFLPNSIYMLSFTCILPRPQNL